MNNAWRCWPKPQFTAVEGATAAAGQLAARDIQVFTGFNNLRKFAGRNVQTSVTVPYLSRVLRFSHPVEERMNTARAAHSPPEVRGSFPD